MADTPFIITIDTEGDNLWARPREITTRNAAYLPRFQALCETFRFKPVYLVNVNGYWDPLLAMLEAVVSGGFAAPSLKDFVTPVADASALEAALAAHLG